MPKKNVTEEPGQKNVRQKNMKGLRKEIFLSGLLPIFLSHIFLSDLLPIFLSHIFLSGFR
jgi:hypothetical protein